MIARVVDFSVKNPLVVFAVVAVAALAGLWSIERMPLDAIPDLSDTQVIVYSRWDRSPDVIEDQVTYPIVTAMLGAPGVRAVRGFSDFGYSFVYVVFEDGTDLYWARSRTLEYLSTVLPSLPEGVKTELGPDALGLGWVFQYALVDESGEHSLADLRSYQDWYLRYHLKAVPGVAEVAAVGGYAKQYQVNVDPNRLRAYGIPIQKVVEAVRGGNVEVGGRLIEFGGTEYMVRGRGYAQSVEDFEDIVVAGGDTGSPIRVRDLGEVVLGPDLRRGVADLDGRGEVVSGIVVMRQKQNALEVIDRVKAKLREIEPGLPKGVRVVTAYDRSDLIRRAVHTLSWTIVEVILTISVVILLFLWHVPSAIIPVVTIPLAVLIAFVPFGAMGLTANIMSLGGIAIAIGALDDAAIVVVEQTHKKLERWEKGGRIGDYRAVVQQAITEVAGPSFFSLLVIGVSFLPVLALEAQEGRLFKPLAYTKTLAMLVAAVLAITLDPALRMLLTRRQDFAFRPAWLRRVANTVLVGRIRQEETHPVNRALMRAYEPAAAWSLRNKWLVIGVALLLIVATVPVFLSLGSEFMPPLEEGTLFYMPTTMPGISITEATKLLQVTDRVIKSFPEVERVLGKAGRAGTSTDPAPLSMLETVVTLKPKSEWRRVDTWYSGWAPEWLKPAFRWMTPDHVSQEQLVEQMNDALRLPGLSNAWTMPIKGRIDMLATGIRTPVGLKISGADLGEIERIGAEVEELLERVPGARSVFAERTAAGYFLDIRWKRKELARYGLSVEEAQAVVAAAIGGENVTTTVEGRERYAVNVRYLPDFRADIGSLGRVLVPLGDGQKQIALAQLADIEVKSGPGMIRNEDGLLTGYVYVDLAGRDPGSFVRKPTPGAHAREAATGARDLLERAVRGDGARAGAAGGGGSRHPRHHPDPSLRQHAVGGEDADRPPRRPLLRDRGGVVSLGPRLQHEHRRLGGADRPPGSRRRDWRLHAALPGPRLRAGEARGSLEVASRATHRHHGGCGPAPAAEVHDGHHDLHRTGPHHVGHGRRRRHHETHCRPVGRRHPDVLPAGAARLPRDLRDLEVALRAEARARRPHHTFPRADIAGSRNARTPLPFGWPCARGSAYFP